MPRAEPASRLGRLHGEARLAAARDGWQVLLEALRHPAAAQIGLLAEFLDILAATGAEPIKSLGISDALGARCSGEAVSSAAPARQAIVSLIMSFPGWRIAFLIDR